MVERRSKEGVSLRMIGEMLSLIKLVLLCIKMLLMWNHNQQGLAG